MALHDSTGCIFTVETPDEPNQTDVSPHSNGCTGVNLYCGNTDTTKLTSNTNIQIIIRMQQDIYDESKSCNEIVSFHDCYLLFQAI